MLFSEQIIHNNLVLHNAGMNTAQNAVGSHHSCSKAFSGLGFCLEDGQTIAQLFLIFLGDGGQYDRLPNKPIEVTDPWDLGGDGKTFFGGQPR